MTQTTKKLHVLFAIPSIQKGGGAEKVFVSLANTISRDLFQVTFLVVNDNQTLSKTLKEDVRFISLNKSRTITSAFALYRTIVKESPDIILSTSFHLNTLLMLFKPFLPKSTRLVLREFGIIKRTFQDQKNNVSAWFQHLIYKRCIKKQDAIIVQSNAMKQSYIDDYHVPEQLLHVMYNPVENVNCNRDDWLVPKELENRDVSYIVSVGRLVPEKGMDLLIQAMEYVDNRYRLVIVGDGPLKSDLQELVNRLNLGERVMLVGFKELVTPYLIWADLFVLCSHYEGLPNVLLEALACGNPVVTSNFSCAKEIVNERNGLICDSRDPKLFAGTINSMDLTRYSTKEIEKECLSKFGLSKIVDEYNRLLKNNFSILTI